MPQIHQKRINSLMVATESIHDCNQLSLIQLDRDIIGTIAPKHNIKRIDRLLGNVHLAQDKMPIYSGMLVIYAAPILCPSSSLIGLMFVNNCV